MAKYYYFPVVKKILSTDTIMIFTKNIPIIDKKL